MRGVKSPIGSPPQIKVSSVGTSLGVIILATAGVKKAQSTLARFMKPYSGGAGVVHLRTVLFGTGAHSTMLNDYALWSACATRGENDIRSVVRSHSWTRLVAESWQLQNRLMRYGEHGHFQIRQVPSDERSSSLVGGHDHHWTSSIRNDECQAFSRTSPITSAASGQMTSVLVEEGLTAHIQGFLDLAKRAILMIHAVGKARARGLQGFLNGHGVVQRKVTDDEVDKDSSSALDATDSRAGRTDGFVNGTSQLFPCLVIGDLDKREIGRRHKVGPGNRSNRVQKSCLKYPNPFANLLLLTKVPTVRHYNTERLVVIGADCDADTGGNKGGGIKIVSLLL
ncbi:hypothetical protein HG531_010786 [Fusarium graminearum]|nr:hypothetical protein HG531_010786 [Fusarium graminearum]